MFHSGYVVEKREKCKEKKGKNSPHVKGGEINKKKSMWANFERGRTDL